MPSIVQVNVSLTIAPTPATLQQTGAMISQGATDTSPWTVTLLTQASDLTPVLQGAHTLSNLTFSAGTATATTTSPHGLTIGDAIEITISGATPAGYNGTFLATITGASAFTYPLTGSPSTPASVFGSFTLEDVSELASMVNTYFSQGTKRAVYVLELGPGTVNEGVASLSAYLTANPNTNYVAGATGFFYSYLVPRTWDANANFLALMASFQNPNSQTYFFITTTLATYQVYTNLMKCAFCMIEAPVQNAYAANALTAISYTSGIVTATTTTNHGVTPGSWFTIAGVSPSGYNGTFLALPGTGSSTLIYALPANPGAETVLGTLQVSYYASVGIPFNEFSCAAPFYVTLSYQPSATNKVTPTAFSFLFGVTPFPTKGNNALLTTLKAASINYVGTGAEGGISNAVLFWGTTKDARDFTYWYSVDWVQITVNENVSNAVINGSNNPINPLYYNQDGINRLQQVAAQTMQSGVTFGMVLGDVVQTSLDGPDLDTALNDGVYPDLTVVNGIPFLAYTSENPGDYKIGEYDGFAIIYVPARGFIHIIFNVNVTDFVSQ